MVDFYIHLVIGLEIGIEHPYDGVLLKLHTPYCHALLSCLVTCVFLDRKNQAKGYLSPATA